MSTYNLYRISTRDATFYVIAPDAGEAAVKGREVIDEPGIAVTHVALDGNGVPYRVVAPTVDQAPAFVWNDHDNQLGDWCPWSGKSIGDDVDPDDDIACPAGCPASHIEEVGEGG